jgi:hypothetical protein
MKVADALIRRMKMSKTPFLYQEKRLLFGLLAVTSFGAAPGKNKR